VAVMDKVINSVFHKKGHKKEKETTDCLPRDFIVKNI